MIDQALKFLSRYWLHIGALGAAFVLGAVLVFGALEADRIKAKLSDMFQSDPAHPDTLTAEWKTLETNLLTLERLDVPLGNVDGSATGGAIDTFSGYLLYASANGHLGTLNLGTGALRYSGIRVPMDYDAVRQNVFADKIQFNQNWYRVHDLYIRQTDTQNADLYVSHHIFREDDQTICNVVNRTQISATSEGLTFSGNWEEIFRLDVCVPLIDYDWRFNGHMSGGRMATYDDEHILLSVGEFGLANFLNTPELVQGDSGNQLAKILKLNLATGEAFVFASGVRNPQGLTRDRHGRIWETEHAAKGGDELNLLREGLDYGWPNVALGTEYGAPRTAFPRTPVQGSHNGYESPTYAFVPSIGVAGLLSVSGENGFSLWQDDLLVASLVGETLYRLRPDGDRIIYAEPMKLGARLRDIIAMPNGWVAILTGNRSVIFLRDAEANSEAERTFTSAGYDALAPLEQAARNFSGNYSWGRDLFRGACSSCHRVDGETEVAPPLNAIIGRRIGQYEGYPYSEALENASGRWTAGKLNNFMANPQEAFPGTTMPGINLDKYERRAVVEYLQGLEE